MSRRWRVALWWAGSAAGVIVMLGVAAVLALRSNWFFEKVRLGIVDTVETATGGRVEIASVQFDWKRLHASVRGFTLHGMEPADKPPLLHASSVAVGLHVVSLFKRDVDVQSVEVDDPHIYLIIYPDGHTNVPEPKIKPSIKRNVAETILSLAVGQFAVRNGLFEVEARGATPFEARGRNLAARLRYELAGPRYRGEISMQTLDANFPGLPMVPVGVQLAVEIERNRITVPSGKISTGDSQVLLSGAIEDLNTPHGSFRYEARAAVGDAVRILGIDELKRGTVEVTGEALWKGASDVSASGKLHAYGMEYRDSTMRLRDYTVDGAVSATPEGLNASGLRLSGTLAGVGPMPVEMASATLRGRDLTCRGVTAQALGGTFRGEAELRNLERYSAGGDIAGFDVRRVVALFTPGPLPWSGTAAGKMSVEGSLKSKLALRIAGDLEIGPAAGSAPVHGKITATYEARGGSIDVGRSMLALPSSRADFAGALSRTGSGELNVHFETRDLNDVLPALGENAAEFPVKLAGGAATFDGTVSGSLDQPAIAGHLTSGKFSLLGTEVDALAGDVKASSEHVLLENASAARGQLRAQFRGEAAIHEWKAGDTTQIFGNATLARADISDVAALLELKDLPASGMLAGSGQVSGTVGNPVVSGDLEATKGTIRDEPFDRFAGHVQYASHKAVLTGGQLAAGAKQAEVAATYEFTPAGLDTGRLHFQVSTNATPLEQIRTLQDARPGAKGTVTVKASGDLDITPQTVRVGSLEADIAGQDLQLGGQSFGSARLTATSQGQVLQAHLESDFANSTIRGEGSWQLQGDYPGSATIRFPKLDFARLRAWIAPAQAGVADPVSGSAEGELRIEGPALKPAAMKAELRIPKIEIQPTLGTLPAGAAITLTNSGPIVATLANSVVTIESARLTGRGTDISITGRAVIDQKNPLDFRLNGHADMALIQGFDKDLVASGSVTADATVRGALDAPQLNGRLQVQDGALSLNEFPIGLSKANGVVLLANDRATIQNLTGEVGGGRIEVTGFAGYNSGDTLFHLHTRADRVRVRYPEGVSTVANASLNLTGTSTRSMVDGTVTIVRTGFNLQSDFSSVIAKSAEPVRTPAAQTGFLGGLNFDIQINTDPDIQLQSALTEDLQAEANLRLRGTASNPALVGRVSITEGQVVFYGTKYNINQGTISFYNPLKVEPILDVDLETKARGIDISLTVAGPLNKLHLTPRSDPPLQFNEIVALLATGRTPTSDPTLLLQQSTAPQSWQQMGASALLGQAIASPVAGRLQRFFGVSKLRIDPTLPGVENNPQARLTLEQQVTPQITFTYITNVTNSNPQVVRMEWAFSKQWSVVALRDENGTFGLDFFYKKRF